MSKLEKPFCGDTPQLEILVDESAEESLQKLLSVLDLNLISEASGVGRLLDEILQFHQ